MQKIFTRPIPNHEASRKLAADLVREYLAPAGHFTLFLEGGLGAGKTFLVKEILEQLGVTDEVSSPTYALVNEYKVTKENRQKNNAASDHHSALDTQTSTVHYAHWDFYRLEEPADFFARGFQDLADDPAVSHFAEWPEQISPEAKACFGGKRFVLKIDFGLGVGMRKVKLLEHR